MKQAKDTIKNVLAYTLKNNFISKSDYREMNPENKGPAKFYELFKVHKEFGLWEVPPVSPIVSCNGCIIEQLCKFVQYHLKDLSKKHSTYLQDSLDFWDIWRLIWMIKTLLVMMTWLSQYLIGPSLESASYLNLSFRYLSLRDPGILESLVLWTPPIIPPSVLFVYGLVLVWGGGVELWSWRMRLEIDLYIDLKKLDLLLPPTFSSCRLLPPPCYSTQLLHPHLKPPPNFSYLLSKSLRWLMNSYIKIFKCYTAQNSFLVGGD